MHVLSSKTYKSPCSGSLSSISNLYSNPKQPPAFTKILNLACSLFFNVFVNSLIFWWFFFLVVWLIIAKLRNCNLISNFLLQFSVYLNTRIAYVDFPSTLLCFVGSCHSWKVKVFLNENTFLIQASNPWQMREQMMISPPKEDRTIDLGIITINFDADKFITKLEKRLFGTPKFHLWFVPANYFNFVVPKIVYFFPSERRVCVNEFHQVAWELWQLFGVNSPEKNGLIRHLSIPRPPNVSEIETWT